MNVYVVKLMSLVFFLSVYSANIFSNQTFTFSESSINSSPSYWRGIDENTVFYKKLTHVEVGQSWVMKIGKGGQIYSIKTPELGELIDYQRPGKAQWVDGVFQHTIQMPPQKGKTINNTVVDGDIHQAGYYMMSDLNRKEQLLFESVYSPTFSYQFDSVDNSVNYITWPQHAHLPRRYGDNLMLINQTIKDLGGGVVEIEVEFDKWGGARNEIFTLPYSAFRTSTLPQPIRGNSDGSYSALVNHSLRELREKKLRLKLNDESLGGWVALVSSKDPAAQGIGVVFGQGLKESEKRGWVTMGSFVRGNKPEFGGTVISVFRDIDLDIGDALYYRYYLVLGKLKDIQEKANKLESKVVLKKITRSQTEAALLKICLDNDKILTTNCAPDDMPSFYTLKNFVPNAKPLFLLQDASNGDYLMTDDPYEISFDPTDGTTKYVNLLGWILPTPTVPDSCRYQRMNDAVKSIMPQLKLGQNMASLYAILPQKTGCSSSQVK